MHKHLHLQFPRCLLLLAALLLAGCNLKASGPAGPGFPLESLPETRPAIPVPADRDVDDLRDIPQSFAPLTAAAAPDLGVSPDCLERLHQEFLRRYFAPWEGTSPIFSPDESRDSMRSMARAAWYGINQRKVPERRLDKLLENCDLEHFPSRNDSAVALAPAHLRGLPTNLPFFESPHDFPFDMLSYPHVKLNEPLRVLHASRDGVWLFVETGYSNGWLEAREVGLADRSLIEDWKKGPLLVVTRDYAPLPDAGGVGKFRVKIGTLLPVSRSGDGWWQVRIAAPGEEGRARVAESRIAGGEAAPFPLPFLPGQVALIGDQLLGEPYGWGEIFDLRDCSASLRDFFLPFGIWLPRTSGDQIGSTGRRIDLGELTPAQKVERIRAEGIPFLTLLYKPGHIMLYLGQDRSGRPLVFHSAWSLRIWDGSSEHKQMIGKGALTTLEPGKELGLVPGTSLQDLASGMAILTDRCTAGQAE